MRRNGATEPVLCVELEAAARHASKAAIRAELRELVSPNELTRHIETFLSHPAFPVDVRHKQIG